MTTPGPEAFCTVPCCPPFRGREGEWPSLVGRERRCNPAPLLYRPGHGFRVLPPTCSQPVMALMLTTVTAVGEEGEEHTPPYSPPSPEARLPFPSLLLGDHDTRFPLEGPDGGQRRHPPPSVQEHRGNEELRGKGYTVYQRANDDRMTRENGPAAGRPE